MPNPSDLTMKLESKPTGIAQVEDIWAVGEKFLQEIELAVTCEDGVRFFGLDDGLFIEWAAEDGFIGYVEAAAHFEAKNKAERLRG